jgi:hypothetical protein
LGSITSGDPMERTSPFDRPLSSLLSEPTSSSARFSVKQTSLQSDTLAADTPKQDRLGSPKRVIDSSRTSDSDETSSQHSYPINTPEQRSSSTPPTSPLRGPALQTDVAYSEAGAKKKGNSSKGKAVEQRPKVFLSSSKKVIIINSLVRHSRRRR